MSASKKAPHNTASEAATDPLGLIVKALTMGPSGAIEHQEAEGQRSFVNSDTLPMDMPSTSREALERAGVKFLGPVEDDPLFQFVELPEGWRKKPTEHSMWSDLVDAKGRGRGAIFYKAAFYDRSAHMNVERRYSVHKDYDRMDAGVAYVKDGDTTIHMTDPILCERADIYAARDRAAQSAEVWLAEHFPDWKDAAAYWD